MSARKVLHYFKLAEETAKSKKDQRSFMLGAVGIRNDGAIVRSPNSPTSNKERRAHAECKLCRKLSCDAEVFVVRVRFDNGEWAMARPCFSCRKVLKTRRVNKVYYSINNYQYGVWYVEQDLDKVFWF